MFSKLNNAQKLFTKHNSLSGMFSKMVRQSLSPNHAFESNHNTPSNALELRRKV